MWLLAKSIEATRHAGFIYAQHRTGGIYRRAGGRDRRLLVTITGIPAVTFAGTAVIIQESAVTLDRNTHQNAFRETCLNIHPHMLRHTGATHMLWNYCKIHKIEPDVRLATMFQEVLQKQLGHADLETTRMYVRTIVLLKSRNTMPFIIPGNEEEIDERLAKTIRMNIPDLTNRFFVDPSELSHVGPSV